MILVYDSISYTHAIFHYPSAHTISMLLNHYNRPTSSRND